MALIYDYCEVCGSDGIESYVVTTPSRITWMGKGITCHHEAEICSKPNDQLKDTQEYQSSKKKEISF